MLKGAAWIDWSCTTDSSCCRYFRSHILPVACIYRHAAQVWSGTTADGHLDGDDPRYSIRNVRCSHLVRAGRTQNYTVAILPGSARFPAALWSIRI